MKRAKSALSLSLIALFVALAAVPAYAAKPARTTVYDIASGSADFTILAFALEATGLDMALDGNGQYTVFAPTNAAFETAAADLGLTLDELLALLVANPDYLTDVLLYHVAHGRRDSSDVVGSERLRTLQGGFLMQNGGVLTDNLGRDVSIVAVDIMADNGIIHVLNNVVLPYLP